MSEQTKSSLLAMEAYNQIKGECIITSLMPEYARQCGAEGMVVLKNNGILPLQANAKVAVFGRCQVDTFMVGYGSGGDIHPPYHVSILDGLKNSSLVQVNEALARRYESWCHAKENIADPGEYWGWWPHSYPEMPLDEVTVSDAAKESDVAIFVIGRAAGEDRENRMEEGGYYLTAQEKELLALVKKYFRQMVLVFNCGNTIDMAWTTEQDYDAIVYMWLGGMEGGNALADILTGKETPSGKLPATIAREYQDYPSSANFGDPVQNIYEEDIYVGYRYFETFAPEKILYSFGYGLSYTTFETTVEKAYSSEEGFFCTLVVRNSGAAAGKEVVQLYLQPPQGKLGKEHKRLSAYRKTRKLAPGEEEKVTFFVDRSAMASYDDVGKTGVTSAWVLEEGIYEFTCGTSGVDGRLCYASVGTYSQKEFLVIEKLKPVCALQQPIQRMVPKGENSPARLEWEAVPAGTVDMRKRILENLPKEIPYTGDRGIVFADVCAGQATVDDFIAQFTEEELQSLTRGEGGIDRPSGVEGNEGVFGGFYPPVGEKGVPVIVTADGPAGIRINRYTSLLPCGTVLAATFNEALVERLYERMAEEMERFEVDVLLAPGMNIQRNPLCGRNFEYFSEDPYLTGKMGIAAVKGIQSTGRSACPKHFATNNQENARYTNNSVLSERALREIYLPAFRACITQARPKIVMMCYNKINGVWGHYNYDLAKTVLQDEWHHQGMIVTDWWMRKAQSPEFPEMRDNAYRIRAQVDVLMPGNDGPGDGYVRSYDPDETLLETLGKENGITRDEIHRVARNVLNFCRQAEAYRKK